MLRAATRTMALFAPGPALLALCTLGAPSSAAAQAQDVNVINPPQGPVYNQPQSDTWPVVATTIGVFQNNETFHDAVFTGLVPDGYRLIVDFVSVDAVEGAGQRIWANFRSCTGVKPDGWGRIALPLSFAGFLNGESNWQGNVAMHTYLDPDCDARVRAWRPSSGSYANAKVTLQGHMVKTLIGR